MKRLLFQSIFVLCLIAAFALASCNRMEENPDNAQEIQQPAEIAFTATLAPKSENPQTKAISSGIDDNGKEILNVAWTVNEKIALYYKISGGYAKATAKVTEVNDGVATISASLDATTVDGGTVQFVYPASLANDTGDDIDESKLMTQYGKLNGIANSISKQFDAATGDGIIKLSGGTTLPTTATVTNKKGTGSVSLENRVCICKFHLTVYTVGVNNTLVPLDYMNDDLTISDGNGHTYNIKSTKEWPDGMAPAGGPECPGYGTSDDIYVAMLPITDKPLTLSATYKDKNYTLTTKPGTLAAGKFYRNVPVSMCIDPLTITGEITKTLTVPAGKTVTLENATFNVPDGVPAIKLEENSNIILMNGVTISAMNAPAILCEGNAIIWSERSTPVEGIFAPGIQIAEGKTLSFKGDGIINLTGGITIPEDATLIIHGNQVSNDIYIPNEVNISKFGLSFSSTITIPNGGTITLSMAKIQHTSGPGIKCEGNATITLEYGNSISVNADNYSAIEAGNSGTLLTIQGSGSLTAEGGQYAAGIGCGWYGTCGNITINDGTVTAKGGNNGAGIGSGTFGTCGNITIINGTVTAKSGADGAGIGSGHQGSCGIIAIKGGTILADGSSGSGAGIGSGKKGKFESINITDGISEVRALGKTPIGKGDNDMGSGDVTIDGTTTWTAGTATEHLYFSATNSSPATWTLTHK